MVGYLINIVHKRRPKINKRLEKSLMLQGVEVKCLGPTTAMLAFFALRYLLLGMETGLLLLLVTMMVVKHRYAGATAGARTRHVGAGTRWTAAKGVTGMVVVVMVVSMEVVGRGTRQVALANAGLG